MIVEADIRQVQGNLLKQVCPVLVRHKINGAVSGDRGCVFVDHGIFDPEYV